MIKNILTIITTILDTETITPIIAEITTTKMTKNTPNTEIVILTNLAKNPHITLQKIPLITNHEITTKKNNIIKIMIKINIIKIKKIKIIKIMIVIHLFNQLLKKMPHINQNILKKIDLLICMYNLLSSIFNSSYNLTIL
jgi:hypothetical protein